VTGLETRHPGLLHSAMIAPCGINCGVCRLGFKVKGGCRGCRSAEAKPEYCETCRIRTCAEMGPRGRRPRPEALGG
jgi:hypothetical protein